MSLITNVKYIAKINFDPNAEIKFSNGENIRFLATIDGIEKSVPFDSANKDYIEIMEMAEKGEINISDADEPSQEEPQA